MIQTTSEAQFYSCDFGLFWKEKGVVERALKGVAFHQPAVCSSVSLFPPGASAFANVNGGASIRLFLDPWCSNFSYSSLEEGKKWNNFFFKYKMEMTLRCPMSSLVRNPVFPLGFHSPNISKDNSHSLAGLHKTGSYINPEQHNL